MRRPYQRMGSSRRLLSAPSSDRLTMALKSPSNVVVSATPNPISGGTYEQPYQPIKPSLSTRLSRRYHGKEEIKEGGRYTTSMELDQKLYHIAKLEIHNVQNSDKGEYRAVAKNKYGSGTATINLNFEGTGKPK